MENYLNKITESDPQNIVFKITFHFLQTKVLEGEWKEIIIFNLYLNKTQKINEFFPREIPSNTQMDNIYWKTINQIFYTYYHFSMIKECCMRFYPTISHQIVDEWFKILISISSIQELTKKKIEKMSEIYFQTHISLQVSEPRKLNIHLFDDYLLEHRFLEYLFDKEPVIRPRNLSLEMELEEELIDLYTEKSGSCSPSLLSSFKNFELYSKLYNSGHTPYHFWMTTQTPYEDLHEYPGKPIYSCMSPTSFVQ